MTVANETPQQLAELSAYSVMVDNTWLAGAVPLTDTDVVNITNYFQGIFGAYYDTAHRQVLTKACGPGNVT